MKPGSNVRYAVLATLSLALILSSAACSDDPGPPPPPPAGGGKSKAKKKGKGKKSNIKPYDKVDDELRHEFKPRDFAPDLLGEKNRDPFRSYLVAQPLTGADEGADGDITEICPPDRSIATQYSLRDLNLIGIVLRGTSSYAMFRDSAGFGHIVHRGDCVGKEKATINEIGVGYVSIEVTPEAPQGTAAPAPQKRTIALYPEELGVDTIASDASESPR